MSHSLDQIRFHLEATAELLGGPELGPDLVKRAAQAYAAGRNLLAHVPDDPALAPELKELWELEAHARDMLTTATALVGLPCERSS